MNTYIFFTTVSVDAEIEVVAEDETQARNMILEGDFTIRESDIREQLELEHEDMDLELYIDEDGNEHAPVETKELSASGRKIN